jgi:hypothetical protein
VERAVEVLLPHVWWDRDWEGVVPAAIIAHRVHHPGVDLLRVVVERARARTVNGSAQKADGCVDDLVLAVARDSTAQGWPPQMAGRVHQARIRRATANPMGVAGCGHWVGAEEWAARPGLSALAVCDPVFVRYLISALARREPVDDGDRARARADVLTRLDTARPSVVLDLVAELICLGATGEDRARARVAVLGALQAIHPVHVNVVFAALTCLVPTGEDRTGARAQILTALAATRPRGVSRPVRIADVPATWCSRPWTPFGRPLRNDPPACGTSPARCSR